MTVHIILPNYVYNIICGMCSAPKVKMAESVPSTQQDGLLQDHVGIMYHASVQQ